MKALSFWPEWLWVIRHLGKRFENRSWSLPERIKDQRVAFHASQKIGGGKFETGIMNVCSMASHVGIPNTRYSDRVSFVIDGDCIDMFFSEIVTGAVVAVSNFSSSSFGDDVEWGVDEQFHWEMKDTRFIYEPVKCKGAQQFWNVPEDVERRVVMQVV